MSGLSRRKGQHGEAEAAAVFRDAGWTMRGLEGGGDWLAFRGAEYDHNDDALLRPAVTLAVECKRYAARARFPEWLAQAKQDAPPGVPPVLVTRADRGEWIASLPLADLLEMIG